jgi:hypothetical protein
VPAGDTETLGFLLDEERSPVGSVGRVLAREDGLAEWQSF